MTDGVKTLRYTRDRRDRECRFRKVRLATETKKRDWTCNGLQLPGLDPMTNMPFENSPSIEDIEIKFLRSVTSKSCKPDRFRAYLEARERVQVHLKAFYCQTFFRSSKYSVYLAKKASEDKLFDRIRDTFAEEGKALVIFWGCAASRHSGGAAKLGSAPFGRRWPPCGQHANPTACGTVVPPHGTLAAKPQDHLRQASASGASSIVAWPPTHRTASPTSAPP